MNNQQQIINDTITAAINDNKQDVLDILTTDFSIEDNQEIIETLTSEIIDLIDNFDF